MKNYPYGLVLILLFAIFIASLSDAATRRPMAPLRSPIASTIPGIQLPNSHIVAVGQNESVVYRSQAPTTDQDYADVRALGVTDVLIFKNEIGTEVRDERDRLFTDEIIRERSRVRIVSMPWKKLGEFRPNCRKTVRALQVLLATMRSPNRRTLFHCTVGEDRTGFLAGLFRVALGATNLQDVFKNEMCAHGYEAGDPNPNKDMTNVVLPIREELTPFFLTMADRIAASGATTSICEEPMQPVSAERNKEFRCLRAGETP